MHFSEDSLRILSILCFRCRTSSLPANRRLFWNFLLNNDERILFLNFFDNKLQCYRRSKFRCENVFLFLSTKRHEKMVPSRWCFWLSDWFFQLFCKYLMVRINLQRRTSRQRSLPHGLRFLSEEEDFFFASIHHSLDGS